MIAARLGGVLGKWRVTLSADSQSRAGLAPFRVRLARLCVFGLGRGLGLELVEAHKRFVADFTVGAECHEDGLHGVVRGVGEGLYGDEELPAGLGSQKFCVLIPADLGFQLEFVTGQRWPGERLESRQDTRQRDRIGTRLAFEALTKTVS